MNNESLIYQFIERVGAPSAIAFFAIWILGRRADEMAAELRALRAELVLHVNGIRTVLEGRRRGDQPMTLAAEPPERR